MVEEIPSEERVSRHIDSPHKWSPEQRSFVESRLFEFPSPDEVESVVWRKYAVEIGAVHLLGCGRQAFKREKKPNWTYEGAITAVVGDIRAIVSGAGDRLDVIHAPDEGDYHAHVEYRLHQSSDHLRQRKTDLKVHLSKVFAGLEPHSCP